MVQYINTPKRKEGFMNENKNYISIDDRFAIEALLTSLRSKDPNCQVGAVLVSKDNRILSTGYNGTPNGISDKDFPWQKEGSFLDTKYAYVVHAEKNAIFGFTGDRTLLKGSRLYTTLFPCNECMKTIIQVGITEIIYLDNHNFHKDIYEASRRLVAIHNQDSRYPKITLRPYQISLEAQMLMTRSLFKNRTLIDLEPEEETLKRCLVKDKN